jgi:predicted metalloprotease with PDZ domain
MKHNLSKISPVRIIYVAIALTLLSLSNPLSAHEKPADIEYSFQKRDSTSIIITLAFNGAKTGTTLLHLPNEWASATQLYKAISLLKAISAGTSIDSTSKPDEYNIKYSPNARVTLSYVLSKDWTGPLEYPLYFRAVIEGGHFYFEGFSGLAYPDIEYEKLLTCKISYKGFSSNDFIGNSYFSNDSTARFTTTLRDLRNSVFCGGNFRSKVIPIGNHKIVVAITGQYGFTDEEAYTSLSKIIIGEREFWKDKSVPYFFTVLLATQKPGSTGGTAFYNSFALFQSTNIKLSAGMLYTMSHEYFHTWLGSGLDVPQPFELYQWFSEGFTDYYSYKIQYVTGLLSRSDFLNLINKKIRDYYLSPYFTLDNQQSIGHYWESSAHRDLSYRRGLAIAFALDNKLQLTNPAGLDDLLREFYKECKPKMVFDKSKFDQLVLKYTNSATLAAIDSANKGKNDGLTNLLTTSGHYKAETAVIGKVFDLGFDYEASRKAKKIVGLKPGCNAEKAGLTENTDLAGGFSFWFNDAEKPAKVQVINNGEKKWIEFMPAAPADIKVPQVKVENGG